MNNNRSDQETEMGNIRDRITITRGNIVEQDTSAIVNAANTQLVLGSGVAGAIRMADDGSVQRECDRIGKVRLGGAVITSGGATGIPFIVHAAGMHMGCPADIDSVRSAYRNSLLKASAKGITSISFPAIGTGVGGLTLDSCAVVSIEEARNHLAGETSLKEIRFVLFDDEAHEIFKDVLNRLVPA